MGPNRVDRYGHAFADLMQVEAFEQQEGKLRLSFRQTIELCEQRARNSCLEIGIVDKNQNGGDRSASRYDAVCALGSKR